MPLISPTACGLIHFRIRFTQVFIREFVVNFDFLFHLLMDRFDYLNIAFEASWLLLIDYPSHSVQPF